MVDTNIFLEILLDQERSSDCKVFLTKNYDKIFSSDFSLHSIGVIQFRYKKKEIFKYFIQDILPEIKILNLPSSAYDIFTEISLLPNLDFDDPYQYSIAKYFDLELVTMDADFKKVKDIKIEFL
ncbi:type II toxin-antitoxin system VapC family toxin [Calditrichota bacterium GD2]